MGLIKKVEEKLSGSSSNDSNKLEKQGYSSNTSSTGTGSRIQNPISSSDGGTYGTSTTGASSNYSSNYPQDDRSYASTSGTQSNYPPSSYPQNTSGYTSTSSTKDRMPGSYVNDESHIPKTTTTTTTNTNISSNAARQPFDPYSSKGQETAARAGTTGYTSNTIPQYSRTHGEDPSISRSRDGGVLNQPTDQQYGSHHTSTTSPTSGSDHHYGRDAALGAGALGAGGAGAYEMGKHQPSHQPLTSSTGQQYGQQQDVSYMQHNQPTPVANDSGMTGGASGGSPTGGNISGGNMPAGQAGGVPGESPGLTQARKMGGAYEAGYRDAMEHMQAEMRNKTGAGSGQPFWIRD